MDRSVRDSRRTAARAAEAEVRAERERRMTGPADKLHDSLVVVLPLLEVVAVEQRRWAQQ